MKLKLVKSDWLDDWYCIEKAEHDGREWMEPVDRNSYCLRRSARISDADVEGTAEEMVALAAAIKDRGQKGFKRCAVNVRKDGVHFWSPRNSRKDGVVSLCDADDLAVQIESVLLEAPCAT